MQGTIERLKADIRRAHTVAAEYRRLERAMQEELSALESLWRPGGAVAAGLLPVLEPGALPGATVAPAIAVILTGGMSAEDAISLKVRERELSQRLAILTETRSAMEDKIRTIESTAREREEEAHRLADAIKHEEGEIARRRAAMDAGLPVRAGESQASLEDRNVLHRAVEEPRLQEAERELEKKRGILRSMLGG